MLKNLLAVVLTLSTAVYSPSVWAAAADPDVEKGIALVKQGENAQAILVLDAAARRLAARSGMQLEASRAYLNLGFAYVGEGQESLAKASFREALLRNERLELSAVETSPKVREIFQRAKDELAQRKLAEKKGGGGGKAALIVLGVLAVGGGAAAAALAATEEEDPPSMPCNMTVNTKEPTIPFNTTMSVREARVTAIGLDIPRPHDGDHTASVRAFLVSGGRDCYEATSSVLIPGSTCQRTANLSFTLDSSALARGCIPPFTLNAMRHETTYTSASGPSTAQGLVSGPINYQMVP